MDKNKLLQRLEQEGQQTLLFLKKLEDQEWRLQIYTGDMGWTAHQFLAHFISVERAFQWLIANIVSGGTGTPPEFDLDRFNQEQVMSLQEHSRHDLLSIYQAERATTLSQVTQYDSMDLLKEGDHPYFGQLSVEALLKLLYRHSKLHIRDIRRALAG
jgi:hypothetical protein